MKLQFAIHIAVRHIENPDSVATFVYLFTSTDSPTKITTI